MERIIEIHQRFLSNEHPNQLENNVCEGLSINRLPQKNISKLYIILNLKMDFGEAKFILSQKMNRQLFVVSSERSFGQTYKFHKKNKTQFACASCKTLGKSRIITVRDGRIISSKHPEDDHHIDCHPTPDVNKDVLDID